MVLHWRACRRFFWGAPHRYVAFDDQGRLRFSVYRVRAYDTNLWDIKAHCGGRGTEILTHAYWATEREAIAAVVAWAATHRAS